MWRWPILFRGCVVVYVQLYVHKNQSRGAQLGCLLSGCFLLQFVRKFASWRTCTCSLVGSMSRSGIAGRRGHVFTIVSSRLKGEFPSLSWGSIPCFEMRLMQPRDHPQRPWSPPGCRAGMVSVHHGVGAFCSAVEINEPPHLPSRSRPQGRMCFFILLLPSSSYIHTCSL